MNARLRSLVERRVLAPGHLWMIGVPLEEIAEAPAGERDPRPAVDDRAAGECRCPDACGRDHPNE
jgi:hypothetical protein